jgi:hypothetical protein
MIVHPTDNMATSVESFSQSSHMAVKIVLVEASSTTDTTCTSSVESYFWLSVSPCGLDDSAKPVVLVGSVFNCSGGSIWLNQAVGPLHHITISGLPLVLNVTGMRVVNGVVEFVVRRCLVKINSAQIDSYLFHVLT